MFRQFYFYFLLSYFAVHISLAIPTRNNNNTTAQIAEHSQKQMHDAVGSSEFVEVRRLLDEIKVEAIKRHGLYSDQDPTRERARMRIRDRISVDDGTEASVNRAVSDDLFENDILLTLPQAKEILHEIKEAPSLKRRGGRQANPEPDSVWDTVHIPYVFQLSQTDANWQSNIRSGQRHIESQTCIRFVFYNNEYALRGKDYLQYFRGTGCWSQVGKTGGRQPISIGYGCEGLGIVAHETLHALGIWHEQSRLDRDQHIRVNYDSILPGTESNFEKRAMGTSDNMGQPYDLGSAMHYGNRAFTADSRSFTILTLDRAYQQTIGQRGGLSFKDAKMINLRYCSKICPDKLDCDNDGYTDPLNCNQCRCPDGYGGQYCQGIPNSNTAVCVSPGEFTAGHWSGTVKTTALWSHSECYWRIFPLQPDHRVMISIQRLNFPCKDACSSYLEVKFKKDKVPTGARLCCGVPSVIYGDIGTDVLLILRSDSKLDSYYQGFELIYKSVGPTTTIQPPTDTTTATPTTPTPTTTPTTTTTATKRTTTTTTTTTSKPTTTTTTTTTKRTTITTTTTTTEGTKTTTTEEREEGIWSNWGRWSGCSASCGACGQQKRVRTCYGGRKCKGDSIQIERCAFVVCPAKKVRPNRCQGRLVLPCDLVRMLDFGTLINYDGLRQSQSDNETSEKETPMLDSNILLEDKQISSKSPTQLLLTENNAEVLRRHRRQAVQHKLLMSAASKRIYCEKAFTYNCPTAMLTISMDWHLTDEDTPLAKTVGEDRQCCGGYKPNSNGQCVKSNDGNIEKID